jgi:hypothetical protein
MLSEHKTVRLSTDAADETFSPASSAIPTIRNTAEKRIVTKSYTALVSYGPQGTFPDTGPAQSRYAWCMICRVRIRQYVYFSVGSQTATADEISRFSRDDKAKAPISGREAIDT